MAVIAGALVGGASPVTASELPIATYNIHWAEQIDAHTGGWTRDLDLSRIAADVRRSGAEVVALQEAQSYRVGHRISSEPRALAQLLGWTRGGLRRHVVFHTSRPLAIWCRRQNGTRVRRRINGRLGTCEEHGNAILSRRPLFHGRFIDLFRLDGDLRDGDLYGTPEGRGGLRASVLVNGQVVWLATVHLAFEAPAGACQLRDLLNEIAMLRPLVLFGDFNLELDTEVLRPRCDGVPLRPLELASAQGLMRGEPGGPTYPAFAPKFQIDHVFVSPPLSVLTSRPRSNCDMRRCSSDHRPLTAVVRLPL